MNVPDYDRHALVFLMFSVIEYVGIVSAQPDILFKRLKSTARDSLPGFSMLLQVRKHFGSRICVKIHIKLEAVQS